MAEDIENSTFHHFLMFLVREARISFILLDQNTSIESRKIREHPWKNGKYFSKISETQEFRNVGNLKCPLFEFLEFRIPEFLIIKNDEFMKCMKSRRRGISWDSFCHRNFLKSLDMNFISIKKHETKFPQFLYFRAR